MEPWGFTTLTLVVCISFLIILSLWRKDYKGRRLLPGPPPLPIIGNMLQLDKKDLSMSLCKEGQPCDPIFILACAPCNVISSILFHQRFNDDNGKFLSIMRISSENFNLLNTPMAQLYNNFSWLVRHLPGTHKIYFSNIKKLKEFVLDNIKKHQETLDPNNLKNYIECFLYKMQKDQNNPDSVFDLENLATAGLDLFDAGMETISTTLRYGLLILLKHPGVQDKIYEEIDRVIGNHRIPSIKDKLEMPYTEAVLHEIQRYFNLAPFSLPHEVTHDTQFYQYFIPKDTTVLRLLSSALFNPK